MIETEERERKRAVRERGGTKKRHERDRGVRKTKGRDLQRS